MEESNRIYQAASLMKYIVSCVRLEKSIFPSTSRDRITEKFETANRTKRILITGLRNVGDADMAEETYVSS